MHGDDGMISLAAVVGLLIIVVMIGFLGNCIRAVQQKIEIQNAADSAAYSSALWMARGMNAVTANAAGEKPSKSCTTMPRLVVNS